jgi:hypothetical protein
MFGSTSEHTYWSSDAAWRGVLCQAVAVDATRIIAALAPSSLSRSAMVRTSSARCRQYAGLRRSARKKRPSPARLTQDYKKIQ